MFGFHLGPINFIGLTTTSHHITSHPSAVNSHTYRVIVSATMSKKCTQEEVRRAGNTTSQYNACDSLDGAPVSWRSNNTSSVECDRSQESRVKVDVHNHNAAEQARCASQQQDRLSPPPITNMGLASEAPPCTIEGPKTSRAVSQSTDLSRKNLMILIQILIKYLECSDPRLCAEVKKAIAECTKKNREGHQEYRPLADVITSRLRLVVGDMHWSQLETLMDHYGKKRANAAGITRNTDSPQQIVAV